METMTKIKYSIIIPAYKAQFLKECIDSILAQSYNDYELIILNDASPENIKSIIMNYKNPQISYYENQINVGAVNVVENWNKCLSYAKGDYVICMGDDDKLASNCLETYNEMMLKYPDLDVYHARTIMINEQSEFCDIQEDRPSYETVYSMIWHSTFCSRLQFVGDFLYKTSSLRENGGFFFLPLAWESDYVTSYIMAQKKGIANTHEPIFYYRKNGLSITNSSCIKLKMEATHTYYKWLKSFLVKVPNSLCDKIYRQRLLDGSYDRLLHTEIFMIAEDIKENPIGGFFYWLNKFKNYDMTFKHFVFACILSLGLRFR